MGGVGPPLAGSYVAERKANQRKAKLGFIFPVSFTLSLTLPLTLVHKIPILLCAKNPLFLSGPLASIFPSGSTAGSELLYLCLRCLCHLRVSYSFFSVYLLVFITILKNLYRFRIDIVELVRPRRVLL